MSTLLLRLAAPLQSWGIDAKFDRRGTERVPTKSGVIGLIAAAMGRRRNENLEDLARLKFGIRVEREGTLLRDYHTARNDKSAYVTQRYYLADAVFLVGLNGDDETLVEIEQALNRPAFPLFLGRRSCPPEGKLVLGIRHDKSLLDTLREEPMLITDNSKNLITPKLRMRIMMDADDAAVGVVFKRDDPVSFDQAHRRFGFRRACEINSHFVNNSNGALNPSDYQTHHDPMQELEV